MSRSLRRGALAAVLAVTIAPLAAACGAGSDPQTLEVKPDSVATTVGDVEILNAFIITEPQGATGPAAITARVFNNGTTAQQLTGISVQGASAPVTLTAANGKTGPLTIPAGGSVTLGGSGNPTAELTNSQGVTAGNFQNTVFAFSRTGQVHIAPSVVPAERYFKTYGPGVQVSPSASGAPSANPSGSASPSGLPSASPTTSAKPGAAHSTGPTGTVGKKGKTGAANKPVASSTPKA